MITSLRWRCTRMKGGKCNSGEGEKNCCKRTQKAKETVEIFSNDLSEMSAGCARCSLPLFAKYVIQPDCRDASHDPCSQSGTWKKALAREPAESHFVVITPWPQFTREKSGTSELKRARAWDHEDLLQTVIRAPRSLLPTTGSLSHRVHISVCVVDMWKLCVVVCKGGRGCCHSVAYLADLAYYLCFLSHCSTSILLI